LRDLMGSSAFDRDGRELDARGLYLDMSPWGHHVFEITAAEGPSRASAVAS
jgi:hypothetical protein